MESRDSMTLSNNLKAARMRCKITQEELANALGKSKNVISNWERGDNKPDADTLSTLCSILDVDANYLLDWNERKDIALTLSEQSLIYNYRQLDSYDQEVVGNLISTLSARRPKEFITLPPPNLIPQYGNLASAGSGQFIFDDISPTMVVVDEKIDCDFSIGVNGDSMEPTYYDGDQLLVKKQSSINVGEIGIFMIQGQSYVKELGSHELISHNKKHQNIPLTEETWCIGKVICKTELEVDNFVKQIPTIE